MGKCLSCESFYVSELLVFVSSCLYVVLTILVAVISVTNTIFRSDDDSKYVTNNIIPNSFIISSFYDVSDNDQMKKSSVLDKALSDYLLSFLREQAISKNFISKFKEPSIYINISQEIAKYSVFQLKEKLKNEKALTKFIEKESELPVSATLEVSRSLETVGQIKSYMSSTKLPVILSFPCPEFPSSGFRSSTKANEYFLPDDVIFGNHDVYILYGWNSDYMPRSQIYPEFTEKGGFIAKSFSNLPGHSISFLTGSLSVVEEDELCKSMPISEGSNLSCAVGSCCEKGKNYEFSRLEGNNEVYIMNGNEVKLPLGASATCFKNDETVLADCNYHFIPFSVVDVALSSRSYTSYIEKPVILPLNVTWKLEQSKTIPTKVAKKRPSSIFTTET